MHGNFVSRAARMALAVSLIAHTPGLVMTEARAQAAASRVELEPRGPYGNCSGASGACNAAGGDEKDYEKFKKAFKPVAKDPKTGKPVAKICDIVVYDAKDANGKEGLPTHMALVASLNPDGSVNQTVGQNGSPPVDGSISDSGRGNITLNPVDTLENDGTDTNWEVYTPNDGANPSDAITQAQAAAAKHDPPANQDEALNWLKLLKLCHDRNLALMNAVPQGAPQGAMRPLGQPGVEYVSAPSSPVFSVFVGPVLTASFGTLTTTEVLPGYGVTNQFNNSGSGFGGGATFGALLFPFAQPGSPPGLANLFIGLEAQILALNQTNQQTFASGTSIGTQSNFEASVLLMPGYQITPQVMAYGLAGASMLNETAKITFAPPGSVGATVAGATIGAGARMKIARFLGLPVHLFAEVQHTWWNNATQGNGAYRYTYGSRADTRLQAGVVFEFDPPMLNPAAAH